MQLHLLFTVFVGAVYAATLTPVDCDCVSSEYICNSLFDVRGQSANLSE